jgi:peptide/nickel transport system substrate-binding protein
MDVLKANDVPTRRALTLAYDRVLNMDNQGQLQPMIAESWANPTPTTFTYEIRSDAKFWDGTPVTADDVAYSGQRIVDAAATAAVAAGWGSVESVTASGNTVTVTLTQPDNTFAYRAALEWFVVQKKYSEEAGADLGSPSKPGMGSGPYKVTSYSVSEGATFDLTGTYWGDEPLVKQVVFVTIPDPETARLAMVEGDVDVYFDVPLIATRQYDNASEIAMSYVTGGYNDMLSMRTTTKPFDDVNVRTAMAYLSDTAGLNQPLFNGKATVAKSIVPAIQISSTINDPAKEAEFYAGLPTIPSFDIAKAKEYLAKSSVPGGFSVDLPVDTTQPWMSPFAQNLAQNAKQVGITINVKNVSAGEWIAGLTDPKGSPLQLLALAAGTPSPSELPPVILGSILNVSGYVTPELTKQLNALAAVPTAAETIPLLAPVLMTANSELPYIPLYDEQTALAMGKAYVWLDGYSYWAVAQTWPQSIRSAS